MDRGQTNDIVNTPPPDRRYWPAVEDFQKRETIIKWRDIQQGMYKILEATEQGYNKYGPSVVLNLEHENGPIMFVWAPTFLAYALQKRKRTDYILNLGMKRSEDGYFDFKLC